MTRLVFILAAGAACDAGTVKNDEAEITEGVHSQNGGGEDTGTAQDDESPSEGDTGDQDGPSGSISATAGAVIDPKLGEAPLLWFAFEAEAIPECTIEVSISNGVGQQRTYTETAETLSWDGRDENGQAFDPGPALVALQARCEADPVLIDTLQAQVLRIGLTKIDFVDPEDAGGNVALAFHKNSLSEVQINPIGDRPEYHSGPGGELGSPIDQDDGTPRNPVALWSNPDVAPWANGADVEHNVPTAYITGHSMEMEATIGAVAVSEYRSIAVASWGPKPEEAPPIRLAENGATVLPDMPFSRVFGTAPSTMGRHVQTIEWRFESQSEDGEWHPIPGVFETQHAMYVLAGEPALLDGSSFGASPALPWIGVLQDTSAILEGVPATVGDTLDALRDYLFDHDYVLYDPSSPTYTDYEGAYMYWSSITAQMSSFLDRRAGLRLYCHSMSCMLSALAGNHGVRAEQIVLGVGFNTNYARAAGTDSWGRWSFNSHSVVTPDDGETIWDSSIALDGDDAPGDDGTIDEIMPRGMDGDEYMWRLTYDDIEIINQGLCYME